MRRVVVTGMGAVTPVGNNVKDYFAALTAGKSGITLISKFDTEGYASRIAGEVRNFDAAEVVGAKKIRHLDRFVQLAAAAAGEALRDSRLEINEDNAERIGVIIGSGIGGLRTLEDQHKVLLEKGPRRVNPFLVPMMIPNMAAGNISIIFGAKGPNWCPVSACATGTHAVGEAFETIKRGAADICIAGGSEAPITPLGVAGFCAARSLSKRNDEPTRASRPFDADRDGFVIAEGAGILILEELQSALARRAPIYAEVIGYGATADAYHITSPDISGGGAARSIRAAMREAGITAADIDYINAHGTSTKMNDAMETAAIMSVFGNHAFDVLISSTKSMTGHLLGAAGGIELIAGVMVINSGLVPPTINLEKPDPECQLNYVPNKAVTADIKTVISNSFGFGGHNAAVIVRKYS